MTVNIPTLWKLENGNWYFYEDPDKISNPSGLRTKIQAAVDGAVAGNTPPPDAVLKDLPKDPSFALGRLKVDRPSIIISAGTVQEITIANGLDGPISLNWELLSRESKPTWTGVNVARWRKGYPDLEGRQTPRGPRHVLPTRHAYRGSAECPG